MQISQCGKISRNMPPRSIFAQHNVDVDSGIVHLLSFSLSVLESGVLGKRYIYRAGLIFV